MSERAGLQAVRPSRQRQSADIPATHACACVWARIAGIAGMHGRAGMGRGRARGQEKRLKKMEGLARRNARAGDKGAPAGGDLKQDAKLQEEVKAFKAGLLDACPRCGLRSVSLPACALPAAA